LVSRPQNSSGRRYDGHEAEAARAPDRASCFAEWLDRLKRDAPVKGIASEDIVKDQPEERVEAVIPTRAARRLDELQGGPL
jgi:hypothetical protein